MVAYLGEVIALSTSMIWTVSALSAEASGKRIGALSLNVFTMIFAICFLALTLWVFTGAPFPRYLNTKAILWLLGSGISGFLICNYCLYSSYIYITSRFGQLFATLSAPTAAIMGWIILDEKLTLQECIGIVITLSGIAMSILSGGDKSTGEHKIKIKLPIKGVLFAITAGISQGMALVFGKVGMIHYDTQIPEGMTRLSNFVPISSSFIRVSIGLLGFVLMVMFQKQWPTIKKSMHDKKGVLTALLTTFTGPFLGATCALIAMRYSKAGIAATLLELTPIFIILPAHFIFKQKVRFIEVVGAIVCVAGVSLFFIKC